MIGLGVWEVPVNSMFFKGTAKITVSDNNGEYDFRLEIPGFDIPEMDISNLEVNGNTVSADATCDMLKGQKLHADVTFAETTCEGVLKGPMGIKIKLNGTKIG